MIVTNAAIDRSTTVLVSLILITFAGFTSYFAMPRENYPEIIIPMIIVTTTYEGVSPADIETLLTIPIERELTGIDDVREISSYSAEGVSSIQIEFEPSIDIDTALQKVRDKVDQARPELPTEAEDPTISEINFSEFPIMYLSLQGSVGLPLLTQIAEELEDEIETIKGVLEVKVTGAVEREIQIIVDPTRAGEYGVSMADLVQLAQVENVNTPAGSVELAGAKYLIRVPGEFESAAEIEELVVKASAEGVVYMRDIARVVDGFKEVETKSRLDGAESITLAVSKRSGESIIDISDSVGELVAEYGAALPGDTQLEIIMDQSEEIRDMIAELENSILSGLILVLAVIFVFLGFMNALFVALAIPVSMLLTFIGLHMMGTTLNIVVLFSLMLALGMLVDNGIVIVENIYRHLQMGLSRVEASKRGAGEVAWPIISSTITTVAAFAPMFFWPGIWGEFMKYLPQTLTFSLIGSLFVGLIVNPALASVMMTGSKKQAERDKTRKHRVIHAYVGLLRFALRWRMPTITLAATSLVVISSLYIVQAVIELEPTTEPKSVVIDVDGPQGQSLDVTDGIIGEIEQRVSDLSGVVKFVLANVGSHGSFGMDGGGDSGESNIGRVTVQFPKLSEAKELPSSVLEKLRGRFGDITGAEITVEKSQEGPETGPPVNVEISGPDFDTLTQLAQEVVDIVKTVPNTYNVRDDYDLGKPEIQVEVDRQQALMLGLNTQYIGQTVQAAINGRKAGDYREGDEEYDVVVRFPEAFRHDLSNVEAMTLVNLNGQAIPFSAVADLKQSSGVGFIRRIDRKRTITVSAQVDESRTGPEVLADVTKALEEFRMPPGYTLSYTGENEDLEETQAFLGNAFIVALFLIALILIAQFNSIVQPFIIMTSVILSLAGVFLGLYIFDMRFSVLMTGIGCISLAGVVVNNAIVLIDFINQRRAEGASVEEAIIEAGETRFRPVMLTAVTTILGLIPMALGVSFDFFKWEWIVGGESSQYWGPMATAVVFGLAFATILTLVVVPVLYSLSASAEDFFRPRRKAPAPSPVE
jgi:CzcA family heavy metal efflux pump